MLNPRHLLVLPVLLPATALGQQATNLRTATVYTDLAAAVDAADAGDTLQLDGTFSPTATVDVDRDLTLLGLPGAAVSSDLALVLDVDADVALTVDGVDLLGTGNTQLLRGIGGGNDIVVRDALVSLVASTQTVGGAIQIDSPLSVEIDGVTFRGLPGVRLAGSVGGGALHVRATDVAPLDVTDTRFEDVEGGSGGAIFTANIALTCVRCTFIGGSGAQGGAIHAAGADTVIEQSVFCGTYGTLGGAIFSFDDTEIRNSLFVETSSAVGIAGGSAMYMSDGDWVVENNHFVGIDHSDALFGGTQLDSLHLVNNLFLDNSGGVFLNSANTVATVSYNWFDGNASNSNRTLDVTNETTGGDPDLVSWTRDGNCDNDQLWPTPVTSPLLDAGDPLLLDPDGSTSDIGAYGGTFAASDLHEDLDGDGLSYLLDCDDDDPANFPGNDEVCDLQDNDCDALIDVGAVDSDTFFADCDGDGQGQADEWVEACFPPPTPECGGGWASELTLGDLSWADCDDLDATVFVGAPEDCAPADRDCDGDPTLGAIDAFIYYVDLDGDGFGSEALESCSLVPPDGYSAAGGDCDDRFEGTFPGADDVCGDGVDSSCSGYDGSDEALTSWFPDRDGDGFGDGTAPPVWDCRPGAGLGYADNPSDCDDGLAFVNPGAVEVCNSVDDDCDGTTDNVEATFFWFLDADGDGVGALEFRLEGTCPVEGNWVSVAGDCDDGDPELTVECAGCGCATTGHRSAWVLALALLAVRRRR